MREMDLSTDLALVTEAATDVAVAAAAAAADDDDVIGDMHIKWQSKSCAYAALYYLW